LLLCALSIAALSVIAGMALAQQRSPFRPPIPKTWDEKMLADWATPLAGLNARPSHISAEQYYALPVDDLKTYPVYLAGREPEGYWQMLNSVGPKPMVEPEELKSEADWLTAGRAVFQQMDHVHLRTYDPKFIEVARRGESAFPRADGTAANLRWVPTRDGVALGFPNCANCHVAKLKDGTEVAGAPLLAFPQQRTGAPGPSLINKVQLARGYIDGGSPIRMGSGALGLRLYQAFGVPWNSDDPNVKLKAATQADYDEWFAAGLRGGALPRWSGSLYYPAKIPDIIGIKDRKYIDHTATHLNRGIGDLMRYAAQVSWAESTDFGSHKMLGEGDELPRARRSDEVLYALALYLQSLTPPPNPNPVDDESRAGEKLFQRQGCAGCHVPPLYTSNKLTLAQGFTPPRELPSTLNVLRVSVGTDPALALNTRKGTGFYKVPSLKGVWYRGHYLHDGTVASLEEMFDPERLSEAHVPGGYTPPGMKNRAIRGHEFGLKLKPRERAQLIAFLRTI
jgi:mono/diheme cytochrome c family protein